MSSFAQGALLSELLSPPRSAPTLTLFVLNRASDAREAYGLITKLQAALLPSDQVRLALP